MNDVHYLRSKGKINGPFALAHLRKLASRGVVLQSDEVSPDRVTWKAARDYPGLFDAKPGAARNARIPTSGADSASPIAVASAAIAVPPVVAAPAPTREERQIQTIGRDAAVCDIVLDSLAVSSRHLSLSTTANGVTATDLGSSSGSFVNGSRLTKPRLLVDGDVVTLGGIKLKFDGRTLLREMSDAGFTIQVSGLSREVTDRGTGKLRMLIRNVELTIKPGEFVALVGASGAGKSTLFGALSGRVRATHGQVLYDGRDLYAEFESLRSQIGYVPQRDVFHDALPVVESLRATSRLRLSKDTSTADIDANIDRVLKIVSLSEQRDTIISNLSGGEQKRVAIALELLSRPRVLFLDEPTAPLDPRTTTQMMRLFRSLAEGGITVIMITHAANSLTACDIVAYMHKGLLTFQGPPGQIMTFFGVTDIGEAYAAESRQSPEQWQDYFRSLPMCQDFVASRAVKPRAGKSTRAGQSSAPPHSADWGTMFNQFRVLSRRFFRVLTIDRRNLVVLLALAPLVASMLCLVTSSIETTSKSDPPYYRQQTILCFGSVMIVMFLALFASVREIVKELPIYLHEHFVNVEIIPYLLSKVTVLLAIDAVQTAMVVLVVNWYGHIDAGKPPFQFGILMLCSVVGTMIGLMISAMVNQSDHAVTGMIIIVIPEILFSGALLPMKGVSKLLAAPLITTFWGLNALMSEYPKHDETIYTKAVPSSLIMLGQFVAVAAITYWLMVRKDGPGASERIAAQLKKTLPAAKRPFKPAK